MPEKDGASLPLVCRIEAMLHSFFRPQRVWAKMGVLGYAFYELYSHLCGSTNLMSALAFSRDPLKLSPGRLFDVINADVLAIIDHPSLRPLIENPPLSYFDDSIIRAAATCIEAGTYAVPYVLAAAIPYGVSKLGNAWTCAYDGYCAADVAAQRQKRRKRTADVRGSISAFIDDSLYVFWNGGMPKAFGRYDDGIINLLKRAEDKKSVIVQGALSELLSEALLRGAPLDKSFEYLSGLAGIPRRDHPEKFSDTDSLRILYHVNKELSDLWADEILGRNWMLMLHSESIARAQERYHEQLLRDPNDRIASANHLLLSSLNQDTGSFTESLDSLLSREQPLIDAIPDLHMLDEQKKEKYHEIIAGMTNLNDEYLYYAFLARNHDLIVPGTAKEMMQLQERALSKIFPLIRKMTDGAFGDLGRLGMTKHNVWFLKYGLGHTELVFKEMARDDCEAERDMMHHIKGIVADHTSYSLPELISIIDYRTHESQGSVLVTEQMEGETLDSLIQRSAHADWMLHDIIDYMALLHAKVDSQVVRKGTLDCYAYAEDKLNNPQLGIDESLIEKILSNFDPIIDSLSGSLHGYNGDCHPENWIVHNGGIIKIDVQNEYNTPIVFDLANLLTYRGDILESQHEDLIDRYISSFNTYSDGPIDDREAFILSYHNAVIHRAISFISAWSSESRPCMATLRPRMIKAASQSIHIIRDRFRSYYGAYQSEGEFLYDNLDSALNELRVCIQGNG